MAEGLGVHTYSGAAGTLRFKFLLLMLGDRSNEPVSRLGKQWNRHSHHCSAAGPFGIDDTAA
jgi:hypothetical protein